MTYIICTNISLLDYGDYEVLYGKASPERRCRADRYLQWKDSVRCIIAEALLRCTLDTPVYTVEKTTLGKPYIKGNDDFYFNLSHSDSWVVIAWGDSEVGVDVEKIKGAEGKEEIALRFFSQEEQKYVFEKKEYMQMRFYEIWTGKESYLKYLGTGLQKDMASFSIFSLESEVRLHHRLLPGGYSLTLCTTDDNYLFELLDVHRLLTNEN